VTGICTGIPVVSGDYGVQLVCWDGYAFAYQNWTIHVSDVPPEPPPSPPQATPTNDTGGALLTNPQARFTWILKGDKLIVEDKSFGTVTKRQWSFGDGYGSQDSRAIHQYVLLGNYTVTLTVWDGDSSSTATAIIWVQSHESGNIQRGESGWEVTIGSTTFNINATTSIAIGLGVLLLTFVAPKSPILKSRYLRGFGVLMLMIGVVWFM